MDPEQSSSTPQISRGAGFWIRAGARIIDTTYGIGLGFFAGIVGGITLLISERAGLISPGWQSHLNGFNFTGFGFSLLSGVLYQSLMEGIYGASLGKLICQLRVLTEEGQAIRFPKAILRNLAYFFDALFFGLVAYASMKESPLNQRYGDKWAHAVVVPSKAMPADCRKSAVIFVLALMMASVCSVVLGALGLVLHVI